MAKMNTSAQVRKTIDEAMAVADAERKRKLLNQRLSLARGGIQAFHKHDMGTAIKSFLTYLKILEELKGVEEGALTPQNFDLKKDLSELLMISGIYWDLCKIYDLVKVENKEFRHFLSKYIQFSKGMPYQAVCSESLRKYISNDKPKHRREFKEAYKMIATTKCFVATSLVDTVNLETIPVLRDFRDQVLEKSVLGRGFVRGYYRIGPIVAFGIDRLPDSVREILGKILNRIAKSCQKYTA